MAEHVIEINQALLAEPARQHEKPLRHSLFAVNAYMAGRYDIAAQQLKAVGGDLHPATSAKLSRYKLDKQHIIGEVAILSGPATEEYSKAEALYEKGAIEQAAPLYENALQKLSDQPHAGRLVRRRLAAVLIEKDLASGDWVKLPVHEADLWQIKRGKWSAAKDGALQVHGADASVFVLSPARIGGNFEVRGTFDITAPEQCCHTFGVVIGYRETEPQDWVTCEIWQSGKGPVGAGLLREFYTSKAKPVKGPPLNREGKNEFLVQSWQGKVSWYLNEAPMQTDVEPERADLEHSDIQIGFGAHRICRLNTVTVHNVEVRRIKQQPQAPARE